MQTLGQDMRDKRAREESHRVAAEDFRLCEFPGHLIRRLQQCAVALFVAEVEKAGFDLTPVQYAALSAVSAFPQMDQATLAGVIAYDRATIGGVIDRLQSKGLIVRNSSPKDRRVRLLVLQPAGKRVLAKMEGLMQRVQTRIL